MVKKFDILVHDQDKNVPPKREVGVMAESAKALESMYKMCGQSIEILKTYSDDDCENYGKFTVDPTVGGQGGPMSSGVLGGGTGFLTVDPKEMENLVRVKHSIGAPVDENPVGIVKKPAIPDQSMRNIRLPDPPKFFQVGGIKCKMENGKLYQKQWMRLVDTEVDEIRIVSDKNNRICPLKDKHIEVLRWVLVEDDGNGVRPDGNPETNLELING